MGRIFAIDYGAKRMGTAVTDEMRIIATPLQMILKDNILSFIDDYLQQEQVDIIVVGWPTNLNGDPTDSTQSVQQFIQILEKRYLHAYPQLSIERHDERFTSKMSLDTLIHLGVSKNKRKKKSGLQDKVSATIILQSYLEKIK